jgi:multidrug resistance efflux pump
VGGQVFRRTRSDVVEAQFDHDIAAFKSELVELEDEAKHASGAAKTQLQSKLEAAKGRLDGAVQRARQQVEMLKHEADAKADSLKEQLNQAQGEAGDARVPHPRRQAVQGLGSGQGSAGGLSPPVPHGALAACGPATRLEPNWLA